MDIRRFATLIALVFVSFYSTSQEYLLATASIMQDIVQNVAGDSLMIDCIVPTGGDPHIYEPTPQDAVKITKADVIFKNGLTFEGWLNKLIENNGSNAEVVRLTEGIDPISSLVYDDSSDPHCWMDVGHAIKYADNAYKSLLNRFPARAKSLTANHSRYVDELKKLDQWVKQEINKIPKEQRILITSHDAFQYYGRKYGIQLESLLGTTTDADIQTSDIIRVSQIIKQTRLPAIFVESTINPKVMKQLASDTKVKIGGELFADSLGDKNSPAATYIDLIRHNTNTIVKALSQEKLDDGNLASQDEGSAMDLLKYFLIGLVLVGLLLWIVLRRKK